VGRKISQRFEGASSPENEYECHKSFVYLHRVPRNFGLLFAFAHHRCFCHDLRLNYVNIFHHEGLDGALWVKRLLAPDDDSAIGA
jgi:hypothetical protein